MKTAVCVLLSALAVLLCGCSAERQNQASAAVQKEQEMPPMVQIQKLIITDANLTLDYQVSNPFAEDIWVCHDISAHANQKAQNAATRIDDESGRIKLCFRLERGPGFVNPPDVGKYVRLPPGESCSGKILLSLPIRDYLREWQADRKVHKDVVLRYAVFELGYIRTFGPKWKKLLDSWSEQLKNESIKPKPLVSGPFYLLPREPLLTEETLDGQLREVIYLHGASFVEKEESTKVLITDVNIPCSVVVDDK